MGFPHDLFLNRNLPSVQSKYNGRAGTVIVQAGTKDVVVDGKVSCLNRTVSNSD